MQPFRSRREWLLSLGTHVDPLAHYLDGGATVDEIPRHHILREARVLVVEGVNL